MFFILKLYNLDVADNTKVYVSSYNENILFEGQNNVGATSRLESAKWDLAHDQQSNHEISS